MTLAYEPAQCGITPGPPTRRRSTASSSRIEVCGGLGLVSAACRAIDHYRIFIDLAPVYAP